MEPAAYKFFWRGGLGSAAGTVPAGEISFNAQLAILGLEKEEKLSREVGSKEEVAHERDKTPDRCNRVESVDVSNVKRGSRSWGSWWGKLHGERDKEAREEKTQNVSDPFPQTGETELQQKGLAGKHPKPQKVHSGSAPSLG